MGAGPGQRAAEAESWLPDLIGISSRAGAGAPGEGWSARRSSGLDPGGLEKSILEEEEGRSDYPIPGIHGTLACLELLQLKRAKGVGSGAWSLLYLW